MAQPLCSLLSATAVARVTAANVCNQGASVKKPHRRRNILFGVVLVLGLLVGTVTVIVQHRISLARQGTAAIGEPTAIEQLAESENNGQRFEVTADYSSIVSEDGVTAHTTFTWDDQWFFDDPTEYNGELARACAVFSSIANSESAYYQAGSNIPAYMETLLCKLGFEKVSTASYRYRSEIIDEIANVFTPGGTDTTAYTIASKHVTDSETGQSKLLVMVAIRGSYGTEWLSNVKFGLSSGVLKDFGIDEGDHEGFSQASDEISSAVFNYVDAELKADGSSEEYGDVALLLCGHSRGGATANICASYFDDISDAVDSMERGINPDTGVEITSGELAISHGNIYCYTFATPGVTDNSTCKDSIYDNIFNILNPADIVPRMPLASWGYARYGHDLWLPEYGMVGFDEKFEQVKATFRQNIGCDTKSDPTDVEDVDQIVSDLGEISPTADDFSNLFNIIKSGIALTRDHDVVRIVNGHAPDLYDAWLANVSYEDLRTSR